MRFFALSLLCCVFVALGGADPPVFPSVYTIEGVWQVPASVPPIIEQVTVQYDGISGLEWLGYYGGLGFDLIRLDTNKKYNIHVENNELICTNQPAVGPSVRGRENDAGLIPILPDLSKDWVSKGQGVYRGLQVYHYHLEDKQGEVTNYYDFYTSADEAQKPVGWVAMGYDTIFGSHYDNYVFDFYEYHENVTVDPSRFDVPAMCPTTSSEVSLQASNSRTPARMISATLPHLHDHHDNRFHTFLAKHGKKYDAEEVVQRHTNFFWTTRMIEEHNRKPEKSYTMAMNGFGDWTFDEFKATYLPSRFEVVENAQHRRPYVHSGKVGRPIAWDWRTMNAVAPIKDQATCGSCWAFSAIASLESAWFLANPGMESVQLLSEQDLVDCAYDYGIHQNHGCSGGLFDDAYDYVVSIGGVNSEDDYGYIAFNGYCGHDASKTFAKMSHYENITVRDSDTLMDAIWQKGPVAVAIDVTEKLVYYHSGVFTDPDCGITFDKLNHGVNVVGYDTKLQAWILRNSWSTAWGDDGWFMLQMGDGDCGVTSIPEIPVIEK